MTYNATNATMQAVVWQGTPYSMAVANVSMPTIMNETDVIVRVSSSAICGTDLHTYHGYYGSAEVPWIMGHEAIGYIQSVGDSVHVLHEGAYVIIPDSVDTGHLELAPAAGPAFGLGDDYGEDMGGCQTEYVRVPYADDSLIPIPRTADGTYNTSLELDYLFLSDIFATGWQGVTFSGFEAGDTVVVFGAGPVGLLAAYSAVLRGASRVYSVDHIPQRLALAESIGAIPINFANGSAVQQVMAREPNGVVRSVDCVGMEAQTANGTMQEGIILNQMIEVTRDYGGIGQVGVYDVRTNSTGRPRIDELPVDVSFPVSDFFNKGLTYGAGPVNVMELAPQLLELVHTGKARPSFIVSQEIGIGEAPEYYARFSRREESKVIIRF